jgi:L-amino acid N-acyltransferase YncA
MPRTIEIRLATVADAEPICAIYRPIVESTTISFETVAPDEAEMRARIVETLRLHPWLVLTEDGMVRGYAYASLHRARSAYRWSVDTSVCVAEGSRGQGIGGALYRSLFAILEAQGFARAYAGIALPNPSSVRLHERLGFVPVGVYHAVGYKHGAWRDVGWWEKSIMDCPTPTEPIPLASFAVPSELLTRGLGAL